MLNTFDMRLTSRVVSIDSVVGSPGETGTEGILVRESPLGVKTTGRTLAVSNEVFRPLTSVTFGVLMLFFLKKKREKCRCPDHYNGAHATGSLPDLQNTSVRE